MRKFQSRAIVAGAALLLGASGALGQQPGQLDNVAACRLDAETVQLRFTFEGGACQEPGEAVLETGEGAVGTVTVPTEETAEVCTMQIVPVAFSGVLDAGAEITTLDIGVLGPGGEVQALGSAGIVDEGTQCEAPDAAE